MPLFDTKGRSRERPFVLCALFPPEVSFSTMSPMALPSFLEASALVMQFAARLRPAGPVQRVSLSAGAGRVLAEPVRADRDMPPFPRSTRDGFAVRAAELAAGPIPVAGITRAGQANITELPSGAAWEIMTGAAVPAGADAVVMLEHIENHAGAICLAPGQTVAPGQNIVPTGAEAIAKQELIPAGTRLTAVHIAAAASCGYATLPVFPAPRIAILTTGDELIAVEATPGPAQIRNSNAPMLAALVAQAGGEPWVLPAAADREDDLRMALGDAISADMLLVSGGVSAGKFDLVEPVLAELGAKFHFTGVRIQPGKPLVFGQLAGGQPFFGLPGNPISSAATFLLFAAPQVAALCGSSETGPKFATARLDRDVQGKANLTRFVPARCRCPATPGEPPLAVPTGWQGSGDLAAFARSNCFIVVPEGKLVLPAGSEATILLM